jgi:hypothetical protein
MKKIRSFRTPFTRTRVEPHNLQDPNERWEQCQAIEKILEHTEPSDMPAFSFVLEQVATGKQHVIAPVRFTSSRGKVRA